jgi:hypothetical protein
MRSCLRKRDGLGSSNSDAPTERRTPRSVCVSGDDHGREVNLERAERWMMLKDPEMGFGPTI